MKNTDVEIPSFPPVSASIKELLRGMLTKDQISRIEWSEIFKYEITEQGEVFSPSKMLSQFDRQLKNSLGSSKSSNSHIADPVKVSCKTSFSNSTGDHERFEKSASSLNG